MTFQQLQYILEISQTGSISQTAKNLFVSQPSISISLNALEEELGYPIFFRSPKGLVPTTEGKLVLEYAKRICHTHSLLTSIQKDAKTSVRIASNDTSPVNRAFSRLLCEYRDRNDITFSALQYSATQIMEKLSSCELDVGIILTLNSWVQAVRAQIEGFGLQWKAIKTLPIAIRIGPKHPLYSKADLCVQDFKGERLIESNSHVISNNAYKGILPIDPGNILTARQGELTSMLISEGLGYTVDIKGSEEITEKYRFRYLPLEGFGYNVMVITNPIRPVTPEIQRFIELLEEEFDTDEFNF